MIVGTGRCWVALTHPIKSSPVNPVGTKLASDWIQEIISDTSIDSMELS